VLPNEQEMEAQLGQVSVSKNKTAPAFQIVGRQYFVATNRSTQLPKKMVGQFTPVILDTAGFVEANCPTVDERKQSEELETAWSPQSPPQGIFIPGPASAADHLVQTWNRSFENVG